MTRVPQGTPRQEGLARKKFSNFEGGGKLIRFIEQFLEKSPKFCLKLFFTNKNHNFLEIFAEILLKSQRGDQKKHF
jgi:hypothetical protein